MVVFALVIGIIGEEFGAYVDNLRKGKSRVVESRHTLILGNGDKLIPTIEQICLANESEGGGTVVVLSMTEKVELEEIIRHAAIDTKGTNIVVRTGSPILSADLMKVSAQEARSIIILADRDAHSSDPDATDIMTVRTVLSLRAVDAPKNGHITVELCDVDNEELVRLVGGNRTEQVVSHDVIGRLMIQCARHSGLAQVLCSLLGFEGCEFYMEEWKGLQGRTFGEVLYSFSDAVPIGISRTFSSRKKDGMDGKGRGGVVRFSDDCNGSGSGNDVNTALEAVAVGESNTNASTNSNSKSEGVADDNDNGSDSDSDGGKADEGERHVFLNPPLDMVLREGDKVVVIAEDNDTYKPNEPIPLTAGGPKNWPHPFKICTDMGNSTAALIDIDYVKEIAAPFQAVKELPEKILFVGWRRDMDDMIEQVDGYVAPGSELTLFSHVPLGQREVRTVQQSSTVVVIQSISYIVGFCIRCYF
jgi:Castor and Pollux, part of voltage-gated ion channel